VNLTEFVVGKLRFLEIFSFLGSPIWKQSSTSGINGIL